MTDILFVSIILCLFELLILIQVARAINRVVKRLENIDTTLIDLYQNLDEDLVRIWNIIRDKTL